MSGNDLLDNTELVTLLIEVQTGDKMQINKGSKRLWVSLLIVGAVATFLTFYEPSTTATLTDINSTEEFQKLFNKDDGTPRLILLVSPT